MKTILHVRASAKSNSLLCHGLYSTTNDLTGPVISQGSFKCFSSVAPSNPYVLCLDCSEKLTMMELSDLSL